MSVGSVVCKSQLKLEKQLDMAESGDRRGSRERNPTSQASRRFVSGRRPQVKETKVSPNA